MKPIKFKSSGIDYTYYTVTNLYDVKQLIIDNPVVKGYEIKSSIKSYGNFEYKIISESGINESIMTISWYHGENQIMVVKFPIRCFTDSNLLVRMHRSVDTDTELHYFGGVALKRVNTMKIPCYRFVAPFKSIMMSSKYDHLIDEDGIKKAIKFIMG